MWMGWVLISFFPEGFSTSCKDSSSSEQLKYLYGGN